MENLKIMKKFLKQSDELLNKFKNVKSEIVKNQQYFISKNREKKNYFAEHVVFDLDGTLTIPVLDFTLMRKNIGCPMKQDIIGYCEGIKDEKKRRGKYEIIEKMEEEACENLKLQGNMYEMFDELKNLESFKKRSIVTRNSQKSLEHFTDIAMGKYKDFFEICLSRDYKPSKPDPACLIHIAKRWKTKPTSLIMIGDGYLDVKTAMNCKGISCLFLSEWNDKTLARIIQGEEPDYVIFDLFDVISVLKNEIKIGKTHKKKK